jgi:CubicO group peptidase (beta-lactamase class C family)
MSPSNSLPRSTPEAQGVSSAAIVSFLDAVERNGLGLHSYMLVRHGHVVAEGWWKPYRPDEAHMLFSLSKSFTSTAAGMAIAEGKFSVDDPVLNYFPDEAPDEASPNLAAMRVRHLLTMTTGHETEPDIRTNRDVHWARTFLAHPVEHEPGAKFLYNSVATYMVSAIVQKTTGQRVVEYLRPRLFDQLGIKDAVWEQSPQGIDTGGWGLSLRTEEIAKFGQLYLQNGVWSGERLISEAWIAEATSKQVSNGEGDPNDWNQGYGYQFWRCIPGCYRGDGAFGQFCIVVPARDAVIAITSGSHDMGAIMRDVWYMLLPAMYDAAQADDPAAAAALAARSGALEIATPNGEATSPIGEVVSGREYSLKENDRGIASVKFALNADGGAITIVDKDGANTVPFGFEEWRRGRTRWVDIPERDTAARGRWTAPDTLVVTVCLTNSPWVIVVTARFDGDKITVSMNCKIGISCELEGLAS